MTILVREVVTGLAVRDDGAGDEVLELVRDGVGLSLSIGFVEVPNGSRWSPDRRRVVRTRALVDHVAVVRRGAYLGAEVVGVRSEPEQVARPLLLALARLRAHG
jgi:phage head maturation protease